MEKQSTKKRPNVTCVWKFNLQFCYCKILFQERWCVAKEFLEDLGLLIVKNHWYMQVVKIMWLKNAWICICVQIFFPLPKKFKSEILLKLVEKNETFVCLPNLAKCYYATASFVLWMPNAHDIFAFAINLLGTIWQPKTYYHKTFWGYKNYKAIFNQKLN